MRAVGVDEFGGPEALKVFDLPEPQPLVVTEHRAHHCRCPACGMQTRAAFPEGVSAPVQYGARITAFVLYLLHYQLLPEKRLAALMADLFGVRLVTATIAGMSRSCAARLQDFVTAVRDCVATAPVKHLDETGFRIGGKTQWLHIASTVLLTFYRISQKRGSLPENLTGIIVHDHWKPYYTLQGVLHALCNAHHLRELKALIEIEKEDWARKMQQLLRRACHAANLAREQGVALSPCLIGLFERRYDAIVAAGLARVPNETRVPEERVMDGVNFLLSHDNVINASNKAGVTALHAATMKYEYQELVVPGSSAAYPTLNAIANANADAGEQCRRLGIRPIARLSFPTEGVRT